MQAVSRLLARQQTQEAQLGPLAVRLYGSLVSSGGATPFLKSTSPVPNSEDFSPLLSAIPETQVTTLPNGLRVATESVPFAETATVGLYVAAGSRFESDATNGAANLLERVMFKGTQKRTATDLEAELAGMGASMAAKTGREQVSYSASVLGKDVSKAVGILADVVLNPRLAESDIAAGKDAILAEMKAMGPNSSQLLWDHLHATAFQFSPLGRTVAGPAANLAAMDKGALVEYIKTNFRGPRMVLAAAGAVNHEELVKAASDAFGVVPDGDTTSAVSTLIKGEPARFTGSYVHDRWPTAKVCHMAVAFKGAAANDADSVPLTVMKHMLGSMKAGSDVAVHMAPNLTQVVSSEKLASSYTGFNISYADTGLFGFTGSTTKEQCEDFAYYAMSEMTKMCYDVNDASVALAKNQLKAAILFEQDCTSSVAASIGGELLAYGRRMPRAELLARVDAVDAAAVRGVADKFIFDQDMAVASVGDVQFMPDMGWFRRRSYWKQY